MKTQARRCSTAVFSLFLICQPTGVSQYFGFSLPTPDNLPTDAVVIGASGTRLEEVTQELPFPTPVSLLSEALDLNRYIEQSA